MATYQKITLPEMLEMIQPAKGWVVADQATLPNKCDERVYDWPIPGFQTKASLRVYTSINTDSEVSRPVGADAIRVCAVVFTDKGTFGYIKATRVHRVAGWAKNIRERLVEVYTEAKSRLVKDDAQKILFTQHHAAQVKTAAANQLIPAKGFMNDCPAEVAKFKGKTIAWMREQASKREDVALHLLLTIFAKQTDDEQAMEQTVEDNGVGFSGVDAEFMSSLAKQYQDKGWLSKNQTPHMMKKMKKYAGQYYELTYGKLVAA